MDFINLYLETKLEKYNSQQKDIELNELTDLDFRPFFNLLSRNKRFISSLAIIFTFLSGVYAATRTEIWEGSFQIVVKEKKTTFNAQNSFALLLGSKQNFDIITEEKILKSPLVLSPVYDFVKKEKAKKGILIDETNVNKWLDDNILIKFKEKSTVLQVRYRDADKKLILSTLNLISDRYKEYSRRDRTNEVNNSILYLEDQKRNYEKKVSKSTNKLNKFAIENGLGNVDGFFVNYQSDDNNTTFNLGDLQDEELTKQISELQGGSISRGNSASQRYSSLFNNLEKLELKYNQLSANLQESSPTLQRLKKKIENTKKVLERPTEVISKYNSLLKQASRDDQFLETIQQQLAYYKLEKERKKDTWDLTYDPVLNNVRVYPNIKASMLIALISSSIIGVIISWLKEKLSDEIYNLSDYQSEVPFSYIGNIYSDKNLNEIKIAKFKADNNLKDLKGCIFFMLNESEENNSYKDKILKNSDLKFISKIIEIKNYDYIILVVKSGGITFKKLEKFIIFLTNFKEKVKGWYYLEDKEIMSDIN